MACGWRNGKEHRWIVYILHKTRKKAVFCFSIKMKRVKGGRRQNQPSLCLSCLSDTFSSQPREKGMDSVKLTGYCACVCACVRACMRACVRACARAHTQRKRDRDRERQRKSEMQRGTEKHTHTEGSCMDKKN